MKIEEKRDRNNVRKENHYVLDIAIYARSTAAAKHTESLPSLNSHYHAETVNQEDELLSCITYQAVVSTMENRKGRKWVAIFR